MRSRPVPDPWGDDPRDHRQQQFEPTAPSVWQDSEDSTFAVPGRNHRVPRPRLPVLASFASAGVIAVVLGLGAWVLLA